ncbi:TetR/AcrR family transcriptional regulator [Marisediminicola senii]|uniref:TetR/AcrR family transcriptional regulator n=1 Tax=Marisediminicola senii TaxID=2711233 RepID=UPI0013EBC0F8|nr:TetR/AcrR family transcriptional regulator [Marisediminicola senii]
MPRQKRAGRTLAKIESATRQVLADPNWGRDLLNTNEVARLAGVSIGTIYRYFPDRLALLDYVWPDRGCTYLPIEGPQETTVPAL